MMIGDRAYVELPEDHNWTGKLRKFVVTDSDFNVLISTMRNRRISHIN